MSSPVAKYGAEGAISQTLERALHQACGWAATHGCDIMRRVHVMTRTGRRDIFAFTLYRTLLLLLCWLAVCSPNTSYGLERVGQRGVVHALQQDFGIESTYCPIPQHLRSTWNLEGWQGEGTSSFLQEGEQPANCRQGVP